MLPLSMIELVLLGGYGPTCSSSLRVYKRGSLRSNFTENTVIEPHAERSRIPLFGYKGGTTPRKEKEEKNHWLSVLR